MSEARWKKQGFLSNIYFTLPILIWITRSLIERDDYIFSYSVENRRIWTLERYKAFSPAFWHSICLPY